MAHGHSTIYLALLRGINVGGGNIIRMTDLKACFEATDFENVTTYIQSGNVVFEAPKTDRATLTRVIENALSRTFHPYAARVVVLSQAEMAKIVTKAPKGFGTQPAKYRYDVLFLMPPLTAPAALKSIPFKAGVDQVWPGPGVVYFSRLVARVTQSQISRIVGTPVYQSMTIRNWNTTSKLLGLMETRESSS